MYIYECVYIYMFFFFLVEVKELDESSLFNFVDCDFIELILELGVIIV